MDLKNNKETFPLVIGSATCTACESYQVTMEAFIQKYNVKVYFIDLNELSDEDKANLRLDTNYESTPTTLFYKDGVITQSYNRLVGAGTITDVKKLFKQNEYIK